jgi:DNA-binding transcriptional ArsR family regulator
LAAVTKDVLDLLLHPVRIRIVHAFSGGRTRTTAQLCARLPDVSQASVYRHVAALAGAGVLQVAEEQPIRGAVERHYRLDHERAGINPDTAAAMSRDDHRQAFTAAMAALIADFGAYLDQDDADPSRDRLGYRQLPVWLNDSELTDLIDSIQQIVLPKLRYEARPDRRQYLLSPILIPVADNAGDEA